MIRFVFFLLLLAAVLYGFFWAIDRRNSSGPSAPARPRPRGPLGPDDDVDFLRDLNRKRDPHPGSTPAPNHDLNPDPTPEPEPDPNASQETHEHPE